MRIIQQQPDGFSAQVHVGLGSCQQHLVSGDVSLAGTGFSPVFIHLDIVITGKTVYAHETQVMTGFFIPASRIAQSNN
jgi:leucyl aminopeptidase (aminopeptidase T)